MIENNENFEDFADFYNPNFSIDIFVAVYCWRALFGNMKMDSHHSLDKEKIKSMILGWIKLHNIKIKEKKLEELIVIITPDHFKNGRFDNDEFLNENYFKGDGDDASKIC